MAIDPGYVAVVGYPGVLIVAGALGREPDPDPFAVGNNTQFIPNDPGNRDWQDYQAWAAAGNKAPMEPLANAKTRKIAQLRRQLEGYFYTGFIAQGFQWYTGPWGASQLNLAAGAGAYGTFLTPDHNAHLFDYNDIERVFTPANATKFAAALLHWYYTAYSEYMDKVAQVNACTTNAQVDAVAWTPKYSSQNPFNVDVIPTPGFDTGFDNGYG